MLSARTKEMSEAQGSVARDGARSAQDLRDAIGRHVDLSRQFSRAHIECFQFFKQVFPRMDSGHSDAPSDNQQSPRLTASVRLRANPRLTLFSPDRLNHSGAMDLTVRCKQGEPLDQCGGPDNAIRWISGISCWKSHGARTRTTTDR